MMISPALGSVHSAREQEILNSHAVEEMPVLGSEVHPRGFALISLLE